MLDLLMCECGATESCDDATLTTSEDGADVAAKAEDGVGIALRLAILLEVEDVRARGGTFICDESFLIDFGDEGLCWFSW